MAENIIEDEGIKELERIENEKKQKEAEEREVKRESLQKVENNNQKKKPI